MPEVIVGADCGNSPKKLFLKQFNIAFAEGNAAFIIESVSDDITWNIIGDKLIKGKNDFAQALDNMKKDKIDKLVINSIITMAGKVPCMV
ncbi:MAG: hypothetical protein N2645_20750 [Clostridia bacterium]|nr:hypothetical protein [Clostridia bacterium]